ncbi:response regulator [Azonexus hydrophilus]|jgi:DNA-binding response OmpR family regulator|uniref:response regulator n=1 Tax=Azonexus hydrophilus TaxID=418702 RepID=UPI0004267A83|nr:response regulator [Azonexus hydrophilus]MBS4017372.1 response regulator [Dechloromonas sp.]
MDNKLKVFIVDDDPILLEVLGAVLEADFDREFFGSGEDCLARIAECKPDIVILDLTLPGISGFEVCQRLKEDWDTQDIPILFVSASDDIDTRLQCYEAGGEDFITKPFDPDELLRKVKVAARILGEKRNLHEQAGYAQRTAMSAMVSMGELGVVLQFLSKSFACGTSEELAVALLDSMRQYDLNAAVQLRMDDRSQSFSENGHDLPLEVSVLNHVRHSGRIFQFKTRCVFNYGHVTLLVNNMPLDDPDRCGRIRDNGALLAEGADARMRAIEAEELARHRRAGIEAALPRVQSTLDSVQANYRRNSMELTEIMIEFQEALGRSMMSLGLTESQEESMTTLAADYMQRMVASQDASLQTIGQLQELAQSLAQVLRR